MSRDTINQKIMEKILSNHKIKSEGIIPQSIRNAISKIHQRNHGVTINGAAYDYAKKYGISVYRFLNDKDKESLKHMRENSTPITSSPNSARIKSKKIEPPYSRKFINEANQNAEIYPYVYILENSLRNMILTKLQNNGDWWNNKKIVKEDIKEYADKIMEAEKRHRWLGKSRGNHPIYYVNLEHLYKIIEMNFNPNFKGIFDLSQLKTWINECVPIRNLVAHSIRTQKEERENIKIRVKYICNLIEKDTT